MQIVTNVISTAIIAALFWFMTMYKESDNKRQDNSINKSLTNVEIAQYLYEISMYNKQLVEFVNKGLSDNTKALQDVKSSSDQLKLYLKSNTKETKKLNEKLDLLDELGAVPELKNNIKVWTE